MSGFDPQLLESGEPFTQGFEAPPGTTDWLAPGTNSNWLIMQIDTTSDGGGTGGFLTMSLDYIPFSRFWVRGIGSSADYLNWNGMVIVPSGSNLVVDNASDTDLQVVLEGIIVPARL